MLDLVVADALIVDGTGSAPFRGSVGVEGDRIAWVGREGAEVPAAARTIGAGGAGGRPTNCPDCQVPGDDPAPKGESVSSQPPPEKDNGGSDTTTYLIIGGAIAAAVVVLGGGATLLLRRGR